MGKRIRVTEYLDIDPVNETWCCNRCGHTLGPASKNYKEGTLVLERDPREVHNPVVKERYNFAPNPQWVRILEFICPNCGVRVETEYLPPGHPITHDIELEIDELKKRYGQGDT